LQGEAEIAALNNKEAPTKFSPVQFYFFLLFFFSEIPL
jgi:hypothetical protein